MRKAELKDLSVDFVSLVDEPANQPARMTLRKRSPGEPGQTEGLGLLQSLAKRLGLERFISAEGTPAGDPAGSGQQPQGEPVVKTTPDGKQPDGATGAEGSATDVAKLAKDKADLEQKLEQVQKQLKDKEAAETSLLARVEAIEKASKESALTAEATEITKGVPVKAEDVRKVFGQLDEDGRTIVRDILTKFRGCMKNGGSLSIVGKSADETRGDRSAREVLVEKASEIRKANPKLSQAQAEAVALEQNPDLYDELDPAQTA